MPPTFRFERPYGSLRYLDVGALGRDIGPFRRRKAEHRTQHDERHRSAANSLDYRLWRQVAESIGGALQRLVALLEYGVFDKTPTFWHGQKFKCPPQINSEHPNNTAHTYEATAGELYEFFIKHFQSVTMFGVEKLDTFEQTETVDGNSVETPILIKVEGVILSGQ